MGKGDRTKRFMKDLGKLRNDLSALLDNDTISPEYKPIILRRLDVLMAELEMVREEVESIEVKNS